jgi:hypothetical protein
MPALNTATLPVAANKRAVANTCSSVSALQGPAIKRGWVLPGNHESKGVMFKDNFMLCVVIF